MAAAGPLTFANTLSVGHAPLPAGFGSTAGVADESLLSGFVSHAYAPSIRSQGRLASAANFVSAIGSQIIDKSSPGSGLSICAGKPPGSTAARGVAAQDHRSRELNFCAEHPEVFAKLVGQWVALEGETIVASGESLAPVVAAARKRGIKVPFVFRVEQPLPPGYGDLGL